MQVQSSHDILARLKSDDKGALHAIFQSNYQPVCSAIQRLVPDHGIVEDLAQEVFLRFWQKRHQIEITSSLSAYLRRMAINEALAYLRTQRFFEEVSPAVESDSDAEAQVMHAELEHNIQEAINLLPPKCRVVFQLSRFEELSYQEIADKLGISIKTVENQMSKALKVLRHQLKGYL
ncbi:MAG: RNA polymerase sigma-70 factor [Haliscomenobacter sp.]|nr:RNA polymerase sigma-70 factor [Haliscomenobacter sp.]